MTVARSCQGPMVYYTSTSVASLCALAHATTTLLTVAAAVLLEWVPQQPIRLARALFVQGAEVDHIAGQTVQQRVVRVPDRRSASVEEPAMD